MILEYLVGLAKRRGGGAAAEADAAVAVEDGAVYAYMP
jgi:hypothetical protein